MTGVSRAHRASSSDNRPLRRSSVCLGATLGLVAIIAAGCQSELGDGNPGSEFVAPGAGGPGAPLPPGMTIDPVTGLPTPANPEGNPAVVPGMVQRPPASIGGVTGEVWDANGNNLAVDQLPPLDTACNTPGPQVIRRLTALQYRNTLVGTFGDLVPADQNPLIDPGTLGYNVDADDSLVQGPAAGGIEALAETIAA